MTTALLKAGFIGTLVVVAGIGGDPSALSAATTLPPAHLTSSGKDWSLGAGGRTAESSRLDRPREQILLHEQFGHGRNSRMFNTPESDDWSSALAKVVLAGSNKPRDDELQAAAKKKAEKKKRKKAEKKKRKKATPFKGKKK